MIWLCHRCPTRSVNYSIYPAFVKSFFDFFSKKIESRISGFCRPFRDTPLYGSPTDVPIRRILWDKFAHARIWSGRRESAPSLGSPQTTFRLARMLGSATRSLTLSGVSLRSMRFSLLHVARSLTSIPATAHTSKCRSTSLNCFRIQLRRTYSCEATLLRNASMCEVEWSGRRESNPRNQLGRLVFYH